MQRNRSLLREQMVEFWVQLGRPQIDARVLTDLVARFGAGSMSPASIARLLADEGAQLRHPEILECDARWREAQVMDRGGKCLEIAQLVSGERLNLERAAKLIPKLESLRQEFAEAGDESALSELRRMALEARQRAQASAKHRGLHETDRAEQLEVDEWLKVWLQTPTLFHDWLELRRRSEEFRRRFA